MRGHGMTVAGPSIEICVLRAIYAQRNAEIQTTALLLNSTLSKTAANNEDLEPVYFDESEVRDSAVGNIKTVLRPWSLWKREVEAAQLYTHLGA